MGKIFKRVTQTLLGLTIFAVIVVIFFSWINVKAMNACVDETMKSISETHKVTEISAGDFSQMRVYGIMNFHVKQYEIEDLGNLSVMTVNAGLMQMATIVFTPMDKNLPLLSCDYMYIFSNRKAYVELYDLVEEKDDTYLSWMEQYRAARDQYSDLEDTTASEAWYDSLLTVVTYKKGTIPNDDRLKGLLLDTVSVYMNQADSYESMSPEQKSKKIELVKSYSDRLIDEGGVSTSFFKKSLGEDVTREFFDKVFFGTELYK